ncbi:hypothetical protein MKX03_033902 [Papaver bracteatum]|nr:hypothetical protein MKX03_033902 [Papaver bracteatum]
MATTNGQSEAQAQFQFTKQLYVEDVGPRKIQSIKFSMMSGPEIMKASEVQVCNSGFYDQNRKPKKNALLDSRMGPAGSKMGIICETCHGDFANCPGHYGYLHLCLPVFNVGYFNAILNILKCICKSCARILLSEKERVSYLKKMRNPKAEALQKTATAKAILKSCKPKTCSRCGYINAVVKKAGTVMGIIHDRSKKLTDDTDKECKAALSGTKDSGTRIQILNPVRVLGLFKRILDQDCELLYLSDRPEKLIITDILVPPIAIRPSSFVDGGRSNEDDITSKLNTIIQTNASLQQDLDGKKSTSKCLGDWELLQVEVAQYINSEVRGVPLSMQSSKPLRGFVQRLKGKQGRFRGNLCGKRVEYTARTVISPDPNLKITEVGIPILIAQTLTYPELVSQHNIEKLRKCVLNGAEKYPGAKSVKSADGSMIFHLHRRNRKNLAYGLKFGDIVERHLEDGDVVLFNRQPSLHRMSIMCHRAKIMPWRTLRFNESVCNPYNADFDGDEMNMHVPQTEEARTEALMLMGVQKNLCTPKNGEILVASTQDFLTSSFLITRRDTFYDRASFALMCTYMGDAIESVDFPAPALIKPVELWTGKQLFSVLVRPRAQMRVYVNLTVTEKSYKQGKETLCPNEGFVYFRNSELICGQVGKATLGNGNKDGLFSVLLRDYNAHAAAACMNRLAKLSARWIGNHGFSIGIDDIQPGESLRKEIQDRIKKEKQENDALIQKYKNGQLQVQPGCDAAQTLESELTYLLNGVREKTGKICMGTTEQNKKVDEKVKLHWRNSPLIMSQCGSKGSPDNISQMIACVGQQSVGGRRASNGFIDRNLPHFPKNSTAPDAKGFVENSFYTGLTPTEFFFHTMAGREGLVDTAVKTADTGYMSRRLIKALEDLSIQYDNTVRSASGRVIQFIYGDDGMDPSKMEGKDGSPLNFDRLYMKAKATCPARGHSSLSPTEIKKLADDRLSELIMTPEGGFKEGEEAFKEGKEAFKKSLLDEAAFKEGKEGGFLYKCIASLTNTRKGLQLDEEKMGSQSLEKVSANVAGITLQQLQVFLETCISRYYTKRIEAGTAIGAIGAQSIGEPGTQMTLKTFHFAGVASMNVTLGVPRIKEIINGAKNISTPIITAKLECDRDVRSARMVKGCIEKTVLGEIAESMKIVLESREAYILVKLDMIRCSQLNISAISVQQSLLGHPKLKLSPPKSKLYQDKYIKVVDDRSLKILSPEEDRTKLHFALHSLKSMLPEVVVMGVPTVERVIVSEKQKKGKGTGEYEVFVEGTNLLAVMGIPGVKGEETTSNHIIEVQQTLGIEAARRCIIEEIQHIMKEYRMTIDVRHMMLLADVMTSNGEVLGITRFGIQKMKESVLMLASFEKTQDHLFNGSLNGRVDMIEGVSECIIMGIPMQLGTGILKVRQRVEHIPQLDYGGEPILSCR